MDGQPGYEIHPGSGEYVVNIPAEEVSVRQSKNPLPVDFCRFCSRVLSYPNKTAHVYSLLHRPFRAQNLKEYPVDGLKTIAGMPSSFQDSHIRRYKNNRRARITGSTLISSML